MDRSFLKFSFYFLKKIITLDNDKDFIVSSLAYYLTISLIPLLTITYYFFKLFNIDINFLNSITTNFDITNLFSNNLINIFSTIISIYISSKGLLNYYIYINQKFQIDKLKYHFITSKIYVSIITLLLCIIFPIIYLINHYLENIFILNFFKWIIYSIFLFLLILILNYFLLRKKIKLEYLGIGCFISSILLTFLTFIINIVFTYFQTKEKYYGVLTSYIILIIFLYLISYIIVLGNQINYLFYKKHV